MSTFPTLIPVVAAALIRRDGRVLLQQRRRAGRLGGLWEFPGGKIEAGESLEAALRRELKEELGITPGLRGLVPASFSSDPNPDPQQRDPHAILLYACTAWRGEPRSLASEAIGWFTPAGAGALELPPLDIPLVARLERIVSEALATRSPDAGG